MAVKEMSRIEKYDGKMRPVNKAYKEGRKRIYGEKENAPIEKEEMFYAVTNGGTIEKPFMVNASKAKWLKECKVIVLNKAEYEALVIEKARENK